MSQVAPIPVHDPVEIEPRRMSSARRARIIARDGGCCTYPECRVAVGLEVDHQIALALGGKDDDTNLVTLCFDHHKQKTALDMKLIAKAKRRGLKHRGEFPKAKQKIRGGGFQRRWNG